MCGPGQAVEQTFVILTKEVELCTSRGEDPVGVFRIQ